MASDNCQDDPNNKQKFFNELDLSFQERNEWRVSAIRNQTHAMGNSHSQHHQVPISQWTHSYPRPRHVQPQVKVLPERVSPLQLRTTDNGAILQNGGTISCRKQSVDHGEKLYRPRSSSAHRPPKPDKIILDKGRFGSEPDLRFHVKESRDQFNENAIRQRISRSRKKYKAPLAPQNGMSSGVESSSPDLNVWETKGKEGLGGQYRKGRLFKTRAETNKKIPSNVKIQTVVEPEILGSVEPLDVVKTKLKEDKHQQGGDRVERKELRRSASQEVVSTKKSLATPEFQAELLEAAQRLRPSLVIHPETLLSGKASSFRVITKDKIFKSLNIEIPKENNFEPEKKKINVYEAEETGKNFERRGSRPIKAEEQKEKSERDVPFKKFYFGMKENTNEINIVNSNASTNNVDKTNAEHRLTAVEKSKNLMNLYKSVAQGGQEWEDTVDTFAANFYKTQMSVPNGNTTSCSSSFVSDPDEDVDGGIALQLRPTLPKKTLEIPRFSPTAAWRLLSSIDTLCSQAPSPGGSDDGPLLLEDRIRPPVPQQGERSHDKSGDSGISGDASPGGCHESSSEIAAAAPKNMNPQNTKNILMTWTPQQDLEEESSSEDLESPINSSKNAVCQVPGARFSPRGQLFMPRDQSFPASGLKEDRLCLYNESDVKERSCVELTPKLNSLKKFKVTLGSMKRNDDLDEQSHSPNDNWVLSRSVPSSLNNSHVAVTRSASNPSSPEQDDEYSQQASLNYTSYSYLASGGRIMYLPEYHSRLSPDVSGRRKPNCNVRSGFLSKSCENITQAEMKQVRRSRSPSPVRNRDNNEIRHQHQTVKANQKKKKFTFQSTVRLLENRRLAERLSREAELKENQRLSELEAMKKVEEEFQKKRAREKANIRQQLRLFSLEEKNYTSLPPIEWEENQGDSEGAPSSLPQVSQSLSLKKISVGKKASAVDVNKFTPTTQVLSEFREPSRDYKDYRYFRHQDLHEFPPESNKKSVVEHPRVIYDMPKNTAVYVSAHVNSCAQNQYKEETRVRSSTPRSSSTDNYRRDFAQGTLVNAGRPFPSSDSEISQAQPRSPSRQRLPSRALASVHRSRSASPESLILTGCPLRKIDSFGLSNPSRSRSISPVKIIISQKSKSISPKGSIRKNKLDELPSAEQVSTMHTHSLERKLSNPVDYQSKTLQVVNVEDNNIKCVIRVFEPSGKSGTDSLLRFGLPSLQPFNKTEKSFRPINFNPVINKLAQTVT